MYMQSLFLPTHSWLKKNHQESKIMDELRNNNNNKCAAEEQAEGLNEVIEVYSKALDDLVNVNSLFTMAVFIGLSFASTNQHSLENRPECDPDPIIAKRLILFEVLSFGFFLASSLAAKSLKVILNFYKIEGKLNLNWWLKLFLSRNWRHSLLFLSFAASVGGIISLTLSMINLIQIRLGKIFCGSVYTSKSISSLIVMVSISLAVLYLPPFLIAMFDALNKAKKKQRSRIGHPRV